MMKIIDTYHISRKCVPLKPYNDLKKCLFLAHIDGSICQHPNSK